MARVFVQNNGDGTYSTIYQDDAGNYQEIYRGGQNLAEQNVNVIQETRLGLPQTGGGGGSWNAGAPSGAPGFNMGGGGAYLPFALDAAQQAANQQYLRDRLNKLDIPGFNLQQLLGQAGMTGYYTGGGASLTSDEALDYIWKSRPDLKSFYEKNGWKVGTPDQQRKAVQNWLGMSPEGKEAGGDPVKAATAMGASGGMQEAAAGTPGALPTFAREQWNQANQQWWNQMLGSLSGPRDWARYSQMLPQVFGKVTGQPSWEQAGTDFAGSGRNTPSLDQLAQWWLGGDAGTQGSPTGQPQPIETGQPTASIQPVANDRRLIGPAEGTIQPPPIEVAAGAPTAAIQPVGQARQLPSFRQPTSFRWDEVVGMTPTKRAIEEGKWSYAGLDPQDMWELTRRGAPTGQASPYVRWA